MPESPQAQPAYPLNHEIATVDIQRRAGDVGGSIRSQKSHQLGDFKGLSQALDREVVGVCLVVCHVLNFVYQGQSSSGDSPRMTPFCRGDACVAPTSITENLRVTDH